MPNFTFSLTDVIENLEINDLDRDLEVQNILSMEIPGYELAFQKFKNKNHNQKQNQKFIYQPTKSEQAYLNYWNSYALRRAVDYGYYNIVDTLIRYGANIHHDDCEASRLAAQNGHLEILKLLYISGCRYDSQQEFALRASSALGHYEIVKFLLDKGADARMYDGFAIICARTQKIRDLLEEKVIQPLKNTKVIPKRYNNKDPILTEQQLKNADNQWEDWTRKSNFGKYGSSFCSDFDEHNLSYATSWKPNFSNFYAILLVLLIQVLIF